MPQIPGEVAAWLSLIPIWGAFALAVRACKKAEGRL